MADVKSPADELREAVKRLRCEHVYTLTSDGKCVHCSLIYLEHLTEPIEPLRVALASLLEPIADKIDNETAEFTPECCDDTHTRRGLVHAPCNGWLTTYRGHLPNGPTCRCFDDALAVARVINNTEGAR
ncbi:hypothetical protein ACIBEJ_34765 [Nonomuraea sp. NPDC050790]|uniref:hypothetical protein n=1 Tax=Nonomuraea sp. NPDC050790 TaxID=3364371 RepID=UPI0037A9AE73